jgi:hypothetical protein
MKRWITVGAIIAIIMIFASFSSLAFADTIITFNEVGESKSEHMRTTDFTRLCFTCKTGISGVVLFEPGTSEVSDFVIALTTLGEFPNVETTFFFESDPDVLFFATHSPLIRNEAALLAGLKKRALAGQIPKIVDTGKAQVLSDPSAKINLFRFANGALAPLPSDIFRGGFVVKVTSDLDAVPEPSSLVLLATSLVALSGFSWARKGKEHTADLH